MKPFWKKNIFPYLINGTLMACLGILSSQAWGQAPSWPHGDGQLRIFNYHLGEFAEIQLRGKDQGADFNKADEILRSRDNGEKISIDRNLLNLLDHLQDHFKADTVEIISGYRRPELNEQLLKSGHQVSPKSLHQQGKALDIHLDEIREETLRDYLKSLKLGGVGYYESLDFIHVDTGPKKSWKSSEASSRKLVGVLKDGAPIQLTSDRNDYLPGEIIHFTWIFSQGFQYDQVEDLRLEHFFRGQWLACPQTEKAKNLSTLPAVQLGCIPEKIYGKYRWTFRIAGKNELLSSNEFYLKNK